MAEINKDDLISKEALAVPYDLAKGFEGATDALIKLIGASKSLGDNIKVADSTKKVKEETEKLTLAQIELQKVEKQIATVQAKNNEEYIKAAKALTEVKNAQKEKSIIGERDAKTLNAQNASVDQLVAALKKNRAEYKALATEEARASKEGVALKAVIDQQDAAVKNLNGGLGDFRDNVGDYEGSFSRAGKSFQQIAPGAAGAAQGILGMVKASLAFIATPIGIVIAALGAALFALSSYFKSSEQGQDRLNKIVAVGSAIFEQFMNVVEDIGEAIFNAIENPQQALKDFGKLLKDQIVNRFEGLIELVPALGKAIGLLFKGQFTEAGKVALDAAAKVGLGVENITDKIEAAIDRTKKLVDIGVQYGLKIAAIQAKLDKEERKLIVNRAKTDLEVSKLREEAVTAEGEAKRKTITDAIALEQQLSDKEVAFAALSLKLAKAKLEANGDDKEALKAVAEAQANLFNAQKLAFDNTLKFRKQLESLDKEKGEDPNKERIRAAKEAAEREYLIAKEKLDQKIALIKQEVVQGKKTKEQGDKEILALEKGLADDQIQLQIDRVNKLLSIEGLSADERLALDKELYKLRADLTDAYYKQIGDKEKSSRKKTIEGLSEIQSAYDGFASAVGNLFQAISDKRIQGLDKQSKINEEELDKQLEASEAYYDKEFEAADGNEEQQKAIRQRAEDDKKRLQDQAQKREEALEKERIKSQRKAAQIQKLLAIVSAGISTSLAVLNQLEKGDPYTAFARAAAAGVIGAIEIAAIAAQPIPSYFKGTDSAAGGLSLVGEKGAELMISPSGMASLTPSGPTLMNVAKGTQIIPHEETMRMLAVAGAVTSNYSPIKPESNQAVLNKLDVLIETSRNNKPKESNVIASASVLYDLKEKRAGFTQRLRSRALGKWVE